MLLFSYWVIISQHIWQSGIVVILVAGGFELSDFVKISNPINI